jgi:hypothetical protein
VTSDILIGSDDLLRQVLPLELERSRVLLIDLGEVGSAGDWVFQSASRLVSRLRDDAAAGTLEDRRTIVLAAFPAAGTPDDTAHRAAAVQSLRGVVQSVTREFAHRLSPLNLIAIDRASIREAAGTIRLLDAADGSYVAGSTIDLTDGEVGA